MVMFSKYFGKLMMDLRSGRRWEGGYGEGKNAGEDKGTSEKQTSV